MITREKIGSLVTNGLYKAIVVDETSLLQSKPVECQQCDDKDETIAKLKEAISTLCPKIEHGDLAHMEWLRERIKEHFKDALGESNGD